MPSPWLSSSRHETGGRFGNLNALIFACYSFYYEYLQNFLFKSTKEDSPLKATDFGLSDFIRPGTRFLSWDDGHNL